MRKTLVAVVLMALTTLGLAAPAQADPGTPTYQGQVGSTFSGGSVQFDLVTKGNDQYVAYFNEYRNIVVKHRTLDANGNGAWDSTKVIPESSYASSDTSLDDSKSFKKNWDSHNYLKLAVDFSGRLHLSGDMHRTKLRYWRTTSTTGDLSTLTRFSPLVASGKEGSATYPEFINRSNGSLGWLMFRDGRSGNGDTYVYEWDNGTQSWSQASKLFESDSSYFTDAGQDGSVYSEVYYTLDGWYHIVYNWRQDGNADSNTKFSYLKTTDFVTFENGKGNSVPTPITADAPRPVVDDIAGGDPKFVNNEYHFTTSGSYTVLAYAKTGASGTKQFFVATRTGEAQAWSINQVTNVSGTSGVGTVGNNFPENYIAVLDGNNNVGLDSNYDTYSGKFTKRTTFNLANVGNGPFVPSTLAGHWPSSVYQAGCSTCTPKLTSHVESDSRSRVQAPAGNRYYPNSRPKDATTAYVISWLAGPDIFNPPVPQEPSYDPKPIYIYKVTY